MEGTVTVPNSGGPGISNGYYGDYWAVWPGLLAWNWPATPFNDNATTENGDPWPASGDALLQPILMWTGNSFIYQAVLDLADGAVEYHGSLEYTFPNHVIDGVIEQIATNPDAWYVAAVDLSTGVGSEYTLYNIPNTYNGVTVSKFTTAAIVMPEGWSEYGDSSNNMWGPLTTCADLSSSGSLTYQLKYFEPSQNLSGFRSFVESNNSFRYPPTYPTTCSWNVLSTNFTENSGTATVTFNPN